MKKAPERFLDGFAKRLGTDRKTAARKWASFACYYTPAEVEEIEAGGQKSGVQMARQFLQIFIF